MKTTLYATTLTKFIVPKDFKYAVDEYENIINFQHYQFNIDYACIMRSFYEAKFLSLHENTFTHTRNAHRLKVASYTYTHPISTDYESTISIFYLLSCNLLHLLYMQVTTEKVKHSI